MMYQTLVRLVETSTAVPAGLYVCTWFKPPHLPASIVAWERVE